MKAKSTLNSSCSTHIKRRLSLITRILVNTRPILLLVVSLTSILAESRLYKGELCLLRVRYHSLLGHSQGVIQRRIMLTESSVSLLTRTFPRLLNYRGGQVVLVDVFWLSARKKFKGGGKTIEHCFFKTTCYCFYCSFYCFSKI